jgi:hypothetical protein
MEQEVKAAHGVKLRALAVEHHLTRAVREASFKRLQNH